MDRRQRLLGRDRSAAPAMDRQQPRAGPPVRQEKSSKEVAGHPGRQTDCQADGQAGRQTAGWLSVTRREKQADSRTPSSSVTQQRDASGSARGGACHPSPTACSGWGGRGGCGKPLPRPRPQSSRLLPQGVRKRWEGARPQGKAHCSPKVAR